MLTLFLLIIKFFPGFFRKSCESRPAEIVDNIEFDNGLTFSKYWLNFDSLLPSSPSSGLVVEVSVLDGQR